VLLRVDDDVDHGDVHDLAELPDVQFVDRDEPREPEQLQELRPLLRPLRGASDGRRETGQAGSQETTARSLEERLRRRRTSTGGVEP